MADLVPVLVRVNVVIAWMVMLLSGMAHAECEKGRALYEQAVTQGDTGRRIELLRESLSECKEFNAFLELGKALEARCEEAGSRGAGAQELDSLHKEAEEAFNEALGMAATPEAKARAHSWLGQVYEAMGRQWNAVVSFRQAHACYPSSTRLLEKVRGMEKERSEKGVSADQIKDALSEEGVRDCFGIYVDIPVNFKYDKADLAPEGKTQARELGRALSDSRFREVTFTIIGHTDRNGTEEYNLDLSRKRAQTVKDYLVESFSVDPSRIKTEGKGKSRLLYEGITPEDDSMNRRVEVRLEGAAQ